MHSGGNGCNNIGKLKIYFTKEMFYCCTVADVNRFK